MKIGTKKVPDSGMKRLRVKDMNIGETVIVHIVNGPLRRVTQMWPTVVEDRTTLTMKPTWRSVYVKRDETNVLDNLANIDITLKRQVAVAQKKDAKAIRKSSISKSDRFDYAVLVKRPGEAITCTVLETNWTTHKTIQEKKNAKYPLDPNFLHFGLPYMYDFSITKTRDEKTKQPAYVVNVLNCKTEGKIQVAYLDEEKFPFDNPQQFFTAEELDVLNATTWELDSIDPPVTAAEVMAKLVEFPIDLGRREYNNPGAFMFFHGKEDLQAIINYTHAQNIPILLPNEHELSGAAAPAASAITNQGQAALPPGGAGVGAVDAHFAEVGPEVDDEPPFDATATATPAVTPAAATAASAATPAKPMAEAVPPVRAAAPASTGSFAPAAPSAPQTPTQPAAPAQPQQTPPAAGTFAKKPDLW